MKRLEVGHADISINSLLTWPHQICFNAQLVQTMHDREHVCPMIQGFYFESADFKGLVDHFEELLDVLPSSRGMLV